MTTVFMSMTIVWNKDLGYSRMFAKTVMNLNDIAISNNRGVDCHCIINEIGKSEAVNILQNDLTKERGVL